MGSRSGWKTCPSYRAFPTPDEMSEWAFFLREVRRRRAGTANILLDVNNIYVSPRQSWFF